MTTAEKLKKIEAEFAKKGFEVRASFVDSTRYTWIPGFCDYCNSAINHYIRVLRRPPKPESLPVPKRPLKGRKKATDKWLAATKKWEDREYQRAKWWLGYNLSDVVVCPDRPACRLRKAKKEYKKARKREKEERRRDSAICVALRV